MDETKIEKGVVGLNLNATFDMQNKYSKFFADAQKLAQKHCYERKIVYTDESKPPPNFMD